MRELMISALEMHSSERIKDHSAKYQGTKFNTDSRFVTHNRRAERIRRLGQELDRISLRTITGEHFSKAS